MNDVEKNVEIAKKTLRNEIIERMNKVQSNLLKMYEDGEDHVIGLLHQLVSTMIEMGDGDCHYSDDNFGVSVGRNYIDFVDIESGTSLGTLIFKY